MIKKAASGYGTQPEPLSLQMIQHQVSDQMGEGVSGAVRPRGNGRHQGIGPGVLGFPPIEPTMLLPTSNVARIPKASPVGSGNRYSLNQALPRGSSRVEVWH